MLVAIIVVIVLVLVIVAFAVWRFDDVGFRVRLPFTELELTGRKPRDGRKTNASKTDHHL